METNSAVFLREFGGNLWFSHKARLVSKDGCSILEQIILAGVYVCGGRKGQVALCTTLQSMLGI